jgi:hypothetical protein
MVLVAESSAINPLVATSGIGEVDLNTLYRDRVVEAECFHRIITRLSALSNISNSGAGNA